MKPLFLALLSTIALFPLGNAIASAQPRATLLKQNPSAQWRLADETERKQGWEYILSSPIAIAALNQLAIEGFISPDCPKALYLNDAYDGMQMLLRVRCPVPRGASIAVGYREMRVIFNRFEDNIESFQVQRIRD